MKLLAIFDENILTISRFYGRPYWQIIAFNSENSNVRYSKYREALDSWPDEWDLDENHGPELWENYTRLVIPD